MPFITILNDGKKLRLRPLPDQEWLGESLDIGKNIQGDRSIRERYPQGTILFARELHDVGAFYRAPVVRAATRDEAKKYEGMKFKIDKGEPTELNIFLGI